MSAGPTVQRPPRPDLHSEREAEPCVVVIFGATGDLTRRKLLPALYNLAADGHLPEESCLVGFARRPMTDEQFREDALAAVRVFSRHQPEDEVVERFARNVRYVQSSFEDPAGYEKLTEVCAELDREHDTRGNRLYYLATAPTAFATIVERLGPGVGGQGLGIGGEGLQPPAPNSQPREAHLFPTWTRIVVEKPFGRDLDSARELNRIVGSVFREDQVYRIDHYLGKETVQNILAFRFANGIFESIWNRQYVDHVQITVAESLGVEDRAGYYEESGALRDMVANHMLQVLALVAMEPPIELDATAVRDEKVKVLRAIHPLTPARVAEQTVRGQYGPGVIDGRPVPGYRQEDRVAPDSTTETFVALKLVVDNWRWAGVPFYLRHGKRLPKRSTEVTIQFKPAPEMLFTHADATPPEPNLLTMRIQPNEGLSLRFGAKVPGPGMHVESVTMDVGFRGAAGGPPADAYERLLLDAMQGNPALFTRRDEVEAAWRLVTSILDGWREQPPPEFPNYEAGTRGPKAAEDLIARDGWSWAQL